MAEIIVKAYPTLPEPNIGEILRYAGTADGDEGVMLLLNESIGEALSVISPRVCYAEYSICREETVYDLGFASVASSDLDRALAGCSSIILFAATLGCAPDRLIQKYSRLSPSRALLIDAVCSERIEALCDTFEREVTEGIYHRPRYSPGYGDVPIEIQKKIFASLSPERRIGLTLNDSMLMSPTKSVSAFIGIRR